MAAACTERGWQCVSQGAHRSPAVPAACVRTRQQPCAAPYRLVCAFLRHEIVCRPTCEERRLSRPVKRQLISQLHEEDHEKIFRKIKKNSKISLNPLGTPWSRAPAAMDEMGEPSVAAPCVYTVFKLGAHAQRHQLHTAQGRVCTRHRRHAWLQQRTRGAAPTSPMCSRRPWCRRHSCCARCAWAPGCARVCHWKSPPTYFPTYATETQMFVAGELAAALFAQSPTAFLQASQSVIWAGKSALSQQLL